MGAPLSLDHRAIRRICDLVKKGLDVTPAAVSLGYPKSTVSRYLRLGREAMKKLEDDQPITESEQLYVEFVLSLETASAGLEKDLVLILRAHMKANPGLVLNMLERKFPERWAQANHQDDASQKVLNGIAGIIADIGSRVRASDARQEEPGDENRLPE